MKIDPRERARIRGALTTLLDWLAQVPDARSCETCRHFRTGVCMLAGAKPPAEVQAEGCESWEFDGVPF
jgi:hypothetical protein